MKESVVRILLADDDMEDIELMEAAIHELEPDSQINIVKSGRSAIDFLASTTSNELPCLIVLDYNMPEMNGVDVLKVIAGEQRYSKIPVVILSTSKSEYTARECMEHGACEYFIKPNNVKELEGIGKRMLSICKGAA